MSQTEMDDLFGELATDLVEEFGFECTLLNQEVAYDDASGEEIVGELVETPFKVIPPELASAHEQDMLNLEVGDIVAYTSDSYFAVTVVKPKKTRVRYIDGQEYTVHTAENIRTGLRTPLIKLVLRTQ